MRTALDAHRELLTQGVPHEVVRLRRRVVSADELPDALGVDVGCLAVRLYRVSWEAPSNGSRTGKPADSPGSVHPDAGADGAPAGSARWVAVLVPAGALPDPAALLDALDAVSARAATAAEANAVTGCPAALVCPVGLPDDVEVLADAALGRTDVVYTAVGEASLALGIRTRDLLVAVAARAATLTPAALPVPEPRYADIVDLDQSVAADAGDLAVDLDRHADGGLASDPDGTAGTSRRDDVQARRPPA